MTSVGSKCSENTYISLRKEDNRRLTEAAKKISLKACLVRRRKRAERKSKGKGNDKVSYLSGAFGVEATPDIVVKSKKSKKKKESNTPKPKPAPQKRKPVIAKPEESVTSKPKLVARQFIKMKEIGITFIDDSTVQLIQMS